MERWRRQSNLATWQGHRSSTEHAQKAVVEKTDPRSGLLTRTTSSPAILQTPTRDRQDARREQVVATEALLTSASSWPVDIPRFHPYENSSEEAPRPYASDDLHETARTFRLHTSAAFQGSDKVIYITPPCTACRSRHVHCDRGWPECSRCVKAGSPQSCRRAEGAKWTTVDKLKKRGHRKARRTGDQDGESGQAGVDETHRKKKRHGSRIEGAESSKRSVCTSIPSVSTKLGDDEGGCRARKRSREPTQSGRQAGRKRTRGVLLEAIGEMQALLDSDSAGRWPNAVSLPSSRARQAQCSGSESNKPPRAPPSLWARDVAGIAEVTTLCPVPKSAKSVCVRLSRGGIARGVLLGDASSSHGRNRLSLCGQLTIEIPGPRGKESTSAMPPTQEATVEVKSEDSSKGFLNTSIRDTAAMSTNSVDSPILLGALAHDPMTVGLCRAYVDSTPIHLFLHSDALQLLPCRLPNEVGAVAVGWATVTGVQPCSTKPNTLLLTLQMDEGPSLHWWRPSSAVAEPGWQQTTRRAKWSTLGTVVIHPSDVTAESRSDKSLLRATVCDVCRCAVRRTQWSRWECRECGADMQATFVPNIREDINFGKMPIKFEGPRMDNGRALCLSPVARSLKVWEDGIKSAHYNVPKTCMTRPLRDASNGQTDSEGWQSLRPLSFIHILASGKWTTYCDDLLQSLLLRSMPYRRQDSELMFSMALHTDTSQQQAGASPLPGQPFLLDLHKHVDAAEILIDSVEAVEAYIARYSSFQTTSIAAAYVGQCKRQVELLGAHSSNGTDVKRQLLYLHLGSPALLCVTQRSSIPELSARGNDKRPHSRTILNAVVSHGDVVAIPPGHRQAGPLRMYIEAAEVSVGLLLS
ncbi:unnamed protein product [Parajaminaea phylloscopi]